MIKNISLALVTLIASTHGLALESLITVESRLSRS